MMVIKAKMDAIFAKKCCVFCMRCAAKNVRPIVSDNNISVTKYPKISNFSGDPFP